MNDTIRLVVNFMLLQKNVTAKYRQATIQGRRTGYREITIIVNAPSNGDIVNSHPQILIDPIDIPDAFIAEAMEVPQRKSK